jgi:hypothetical protein
MGRFTRHIDSPMGGLRGFIGIFHTTRRELPIPLLRVPAGHANY